MVRDGVRRMVKTVYKFKRVQVIFWSWGWFLDWNKKWPDGRDDWIFRYYNFGPIEIRVFNTKCGKKGIDMFLEYVEGVNNDKKNSNT